MKLRLSICVVCLLLCAAPMPAQEPGGNPKQQAKELADKAKGEGSDRARQVQDYCAAAQLQPKEKKYVEACNNYREGLINDDTAWLASAIALYKGHDLDKAESTARLVTSYDQKLSGQARFLLDLIKNERLLVQVKAAWAKGDFNTVLSLAQSMTNADSKATANVYVNNVALYNGYLDQAQKLAQSNPQGAIAQLALAQNLNPNGPGNPAGRIAELQKAPQAKSASPPPNLTPALAPKPAVDSAAEIAKKVAKLMADARDAEKQGKLPDALNDYAMVLKLQPGNKDAQSSSDRIGQAIRSDPAAARNELVSAIHFFYQGQFDQAEIALRDYLKSADTAQSPGAANFYLGAALLEQSILETPRAEWQGPSVEAQSALKGARKANYSPARSYVSPILLKIWDSTGP
jgi:hypothetical protein